MAKSYNLLVITNSRNITKIVAILKGLYPDVKCGLVYKNSLQLLVATILSAQSTDERVNLVTSQLFKKYVTVSDFANANIDELAQIIKPIGLYKNKSKNIVTCCQQLVTFFKGVIPQTMPELITLAGVGRKTANVVLGNGFGIASGIAVDTHVKRVSQRVGLTKNSDPLKIEQDLLPIFKQADWVWVNHALIAHGRAVCKARNPQCSACLLSNWCWFFNHR